MELSRRCVEMDLCTHPGSVGQQVHWPGHHWGGGGSYSPSSAFPDSHKWGKKSHRGHSRRLTSDVARPGAGAMHTGSRRSSRISRSET